MKSVPSHYYANTPAQREELRKQAAKLREATRKGREQMAAATAAFDGFASATERARAAFEAFATATPQIAGPQA